MLRLHTSLSPKRCELAHTGENRLNRLTLLSFTKDGVARAISDHVVVHLTTAP